MVALAPRVWPPGDDRSAKYVASGVHEIGYNLELVPGDSVWQRSKEFAAANLAPISASATTSKNQAGETHYGRHYRRESLGQT